MSCADCKTHPMESPGIRRGINAIELTEIILKIARETPLLYL